MNVFVWQGIGDTGPTKDGGKLFGCVESAGADGRQVAEKLDKISQLISNNTKKE